MVRREELPAKAPRALSVLLENPDLHEDERQLMLSEVVEQSEELTTLVASLIELARDPQQTGHFEPLLLDELVEDALPAYGETRHPWPSTQSSSSSWSTRSPANPGGKQPARQRCTSLTSGRSSPSLLI